MSTLSNLITSAVRAVVGAPPTIHDLEATVGRIEAKIAALNLRADEAAEDGDAGAIEAAELSLSVERRLLAVAKRAKAEAEARRDEAAAAEAAAAEAAKSAAIDARKADLDARLEPAAVHASIAPINARLIAARAELLKIAAEHDAARLEHARLHAERAELGGPVEPPIDRDLLTVNLALQAAADDPAKLLALLEDGRSLVKVRTFGLCHETDRPLLEIVDRLGCGSWLEPTPPRPGAYTPSAPVAAALRSLVTLGRSVRTLREFQDAAISAMRAAGDEEHRQRVELEEAAPDRVAARARHAELQRTAGYNLPDGSVKDLPIPMPDNMSIGLDGPHAPNS